MIFSVTISCQQKHPTQTPNEKYTWKKISHTTHTANSNRVHGSTMKKCVLTESKFIYFFLTLESMITNQKRQIIINYSSTKKKIRYIYLYRKKSWASRSECVCNNFLTTLHIMHMNYTSNCSTFFLSLIGAVGEFFALNLSVRVEGVLNEFLTYKLLSTCILSITSK